jgi:hypothetical protein
VVAFCGDLVGLQLGEDRSNGEIRIRVSFVRRERVEIGEGNATTGVRNREVICVRVMPHWKINWRPQSEALIQMG